MKMYTIIWLIHILLFRQTDGILWTLTEHNNVGLELLKSKIIRNT